jgi:diguanylate cyclase (GGDEF)-like protein
MMDIDHFKHVNDTFGHASGDEVLCQFVQRLGQNMQAPDIFGRVGGEEFLAIWVTKGSEEAALKANDGFRLLIENAPFQILGIKLPLTVSIGVTTTSGNETIDDAVARADQSLYCAKDNGRNRTACS